MDVVQGPVARLLSSLFQEIAVHCILHSHTIPFASGRESLRSARVYRDCFTPKTEKTFDHEQPGGEIRIVLGFEAMNGKGDSDVWRKYSQRLGRRKHFFLKD